MNNEITVLIGCSNNGVDTVSRSIRGVYSSKTKATNAAWKLAKNYGGKWFQSGDEFSNGTESFELESYTLNEIPLVEDENLV